VAPSCPVAPIGAGQWRQLVVRYGANCYMAPIGCALWRRWAMAPIGCALWRQLVYGANWLCAMAPIDAVFKILDGDRPIPACFVLFAQLPVSVLLVLGLSRPQLIVAALIPRNAQNDARYTRRPARSQQTTALPRALAVLALVVRTDCFRPQQTPYSPAHDG